MTRTGVLSANDVISSQEVPGPERRISPSSAATTRFCRPVRSGNSSGSSQSETTTVVGSGSSSSVGSASSSACGDSSVAPSSGSSATPGVPESSPESSSSDSEVRVGATPARGVPAPACARGVATGVAAGVPAPTWAVGAAPAGTAAVAVGSSPSSSSPSGPQALTSARISRVRAAWRSQRSSKDRGHRERSEFTGTGREETGVGNSWSMTHAPARFTPTGGR